jgi:hypothetical protein
MATHLVGALFMLVAVALWAVVVLLIDVPF